MALEALKAKQRGNYWIWRAYLPKDMADKLIEKTELCLKLTEEEYEKEVKKYTLQD